MKKLFVSVSGGRTSAYMAHLLKEHHSHEYEMLFVMANTSREHPDTLRFMRDVDRHFGLNLVYVQSVVQEAGKASTFETVSENGLCQDGTVFVKMIQKYGIPNQTFKHCTRELKLNPLHAYVESVWGKDYYTAVGIRADEKRRVSKNAGAGPHNIVYPLIDWHPTRKRDVLHFFSQFD